jgi:hypothetical protein
MHYLPLGDESSPRGRWGICAPALPEVLTHPAMQNLEFLSDLSVVRRRGCNSRAFFYDAPANDVL